MNCNVIKDLLPLYADGVCSSESIELIEGHLRECGECRKMLADMQAQISTTEPMPEPIIKQKKVRLWKASLLQSVLMLISFLILTVGVSMEAGLPEGFTNGLWAFTLVIPATGYMLSLANWYFVRLYRSKRAFMISSVVSTFGMILCAFIWGLSHYGFWRYFKNLYWVGVFFGPGFVFSLILCFVSWLCAHFYADFIGKE